MKLWIKNGRVIDPANDTDDVMDLVINHGMIEDSGENLSVTDADKIIDAAGKWVVPGLIDLHVHLREPGFEHKETIATGTRSGALGGFTTICCMPNTNPVIDNEILVEYVKLKTAREGVINVLPIGAITKGQAGEELSDIGSMAKVGICAVSEDGKTVDNAGLLKTAMKYAAMFRIPVFSHCEEKKLAGKGQMNAGDQAALLGLPGISNDSEEVIVARDIILAKSAKAKLHLCHVSTRGSVQLLRDAKSRLQDVTGEVTPNHFTLTDGDLTAYDANYKMSPPLRSEKDRAALIEALRDGTVDVIATDHAPHHIDEKNCEFEKA
ncbi:MAG: dihydroorotase, partial [Clostridiales bacterium]|nr:dihydroorotase [Clostridiales bacterium]